ncbi:MAG: putative PEP-binding protein [Cyanobacteria bacterium P01_G01_bin.19]
MLTKTVKYIYWLSQIQHTEKTLVGNQLLILSQLIQHDLDVLPGFVVSSNLLSRFLTDSADFQSLIRQLSGSSTDFDLDNYHNLQSVADRSRRTIESLQFPEELVEEIFQAAKQLNSDCLILQPFFSAPTGQNTGSKSFWQSRTCNLDRFILVKTIKAIWSQLFSANSLVYRHKMGLGGQEINLNILVRPLKPVSASGIVEITPEIIRISSVWGHEQSLLQGDVDCDRYYLARHTGNVLSQTLGSKNYGYQINSTDRANPQLDCLTAYIPDEQHTQTYVLERKAIAPLFQLTQAILQKQPQIKYFLWVKLQDDAEIDIADNFWITRLGEELFNSIDLFTLPQTPDLSVIKDANPLLTGIPAAPGKVIGQIAMAENSDSITKSIAADKILVVKQLLPEHIAAIAQAKGIIAETGGRNSHGAIIARELNIPAIVDATEATIILTDGMEVLLDGDLGVVYPAIAVSQLPNQNLASDRSLFHRQPIGTKLMVNISQPDSIAQSLHLPIDGVGLLRSELLLSHLLANTVPADWQSASFQTEFTDYLIESLRQFAVAFAPRPVFYRSLDWNTDSTASSILGIRGTYSYRADPTLFALELNALAAIANEGHVNLNLILPFVRSVDEFKFCYRSIKEAGLTARKSFQVWMMAEVPSVIWLLPEYIQVGVRGIAIGTNDLTQLLLGVDREQAHFSNNGLNANHSAIHQAIAQLIKIARDNHIECCICGQATVEYPSLIEKLIDWGITAISVEPQAIDQTYTAIARAERKLLLDSLRSDLT